MRRKGAGPAIAEQARGMSNVAFAGEIVAVVAARSVKVQK